MASWHALCYRGLIWLGRARRAGGAPVTKLFFSIEKKSKNLDVEIWLEN